MEGREIIKWGLIALGVAIVVGYSCFVLYDFVRGPRIIIYSPQTGFSTTTPMISVIGRGIHTNNVTINDNQTAVDLEGDFSDQLILAPGYNIIRVAAQDNYKRTTEQNIEIVLVVPYSSTSTATTTLPIATSTINTFK